MSGVIYTPPPPEDRYSHLLFLRETTLMAQPFDDRALKLAGDPFPVAAQAIFGGTIGEVAATASANGILAYVAMRPPTGQLLWLDRAGKELGAVGAKRDPSKWHFRRTRKRWQKPLPSLATLRACGCTTWPATRNRGSPSAGARQFGRPKEKPHYLLGWQRSVSEGSSDRRPRSRFCGALTRNTRLIGPRTDASCSIRRKIRRRTAISGMWLTRGKRGRCQAGQVRRHECR